MGLLLMVRLMLTLLLLSGCAANMATLQYEDKGCLAPPVFYDSHVTLSDEGRRRGIQGENSSTLIGLYDYNTRTIHMIRPSVINDQMCTAGHELYHHWFGDFH